MPQLPHKLHRGCGTECRSFPHKLHRGCGTECRSFPHKLHRGCGTSGTKKDTVQNPCPFSAPLYLFFQSTVSLNNSLLPGVYRDLCPVGEMQLAQNVAYMSFHRIFTDHKFIRNLAIGETIGD